MAFLGYSFVTCMSLAPATSRRVVESLASAVSLVWLTYCLVVRSLSAIADTEKPLCSSDQTVFCFWLSGDDSGEFVFITGQVNIWIFTTI